mgnify:CR=1 FL=1
MEKNEALIRRMKKSLSKYAYWNNVLRIRKVTNTGMSFKKTTSCQVACSPGDPCSADPTCSF